MLYQKHQKNSDLLPTRKTFFCVPVPIKPCYALNSHKYPRNTIRAAWPHHLFQNLINDSQNYEAVVNLILHGAKFTPFVTSFVRERLKTMNTNLPPAETEELVLALVGYYQDQRQELEASRKRTEDRHNLEISTAIRNEIRTQQNHDARLNCEKEIHDARLKREKEIHDARLKREKEIHDVEMHERKTMYTAIKEASSQQNLPTQNIALTCEDSETLE